MEIVLSKRQIEVLREEINIQYPNNTTNPNRINKAADAIKNAGDNEEINAVITPTGTTNPDRADYNLIMNNPDGEINSKEATKAREKAQQSGYSVKVPLKNESVKYTKKELNKILFR